MYAPETHTRTKGRTRTTTTLYLVGAHVTETVTEQVETLDTEGNVLTTNRNTYKGDDIVTRYGHMNPVLIEMSL